MASPRHRIEKSVVVKRKGMWMHYLDGGSDTMTEPKHMPGTVFGVARPAEAGAATESAIEVLRLREEAEAIKLLSAEIMDAYGLCRPAQTTHHFTKTS
jgi:hypothetical protein